VNDLMLQYIHMAEKEPKPKTPRARSTTTTKVARKTATKKTTRKKVAAETEVVSAPAVVYEEPIVEEVRPTRSSRRKGMTFGFLLSSFALLSAASAAAVYIGYTSEGQINVAQRLAEAPANFESDGNIGNDDDSEGDTNEPVPQGIPFGTLEVAGDGAVPPPPPQDPATTTESVTEETASSSEAISEEAAPEPQVEGAESSEPAPIEAVTPEEAAATQ
jgi:hypothetical protein